MLRFKWELKTGPCRVPDKRECFSYKEWNDGINMSLHHHTHGCKSYDIRTAGLPKYVCTYAHTLVQIFF